MTHTGWRKAIGDGALRFAGIAAFPRLAYLLRWQTRLGPRGTGVYIASNVAFAWALRLWALPWLERANEKHERIRRELAEQLGREPTDDELFEHLMNAHKR